MALIRQPFFRQPTLIKIYKGEIECERHRIFTSGTTKQKDNLKYRSGYGPIDDDKMVSCPQTVPKKLCPDFVAAVEEL